MTTPHHESSGGGREPLAARLGRSLFVAGLIGPLLTLVYQGAGLWAGQGLVIWQTVLSFAVPFCIAMASKIFDGMTVLNRSVRRNSTSEISMPEAPSTMA